MVGMKNAIVSMCLVLLSLYAAVATTSVGCGGVVRDAKTYRQELLFLEEISKRLAVQQLEQATLAAQASDLERCQRLAEVALIAQARVPYHVAMSMFLADLGKDPGAVPAVPEASAWCTQRGIGQ